MNMFYKLNLIIAITLLLILLIIGVHNLNAGCEHMFDECYLHGSNDWSVAQFCLTSAYWCFFLSFLWMVLYLHMHSLEK